MAVLIAFAFVSGRSASCPRASCLCCRREHIVPESAGALELGFRARKVFLVLQPEAEGGRIDVRVDGEVAADTADVRAGRLEPRESRLYELVDLERAAEQVLSLQVEGRLRLFAFTFG